MKLRMGLLALVASLGILSTGAVTASAATTRTAAPAAGSITVPVTGTTAGGGTFTGTATITHFANQAGQLVASGTLTGTLTNALGTVVGTVTNLPFSIPVASAMGSCPILNLTLGPLDLNLLGLVVHLSQIHLTITAQPGPGNLLGNLLCAVAHLLDSSAPPGALAGLLNRILALL